MVARSPARSGRAAQVIYVRPMAIIVDATSSKNGRPIIKASSLRHVADMRRT